MSIVNLHNMSRFLSALLSTIAWLLVCHVEGIQIQTTYGVIGRPIELTYVSPTNRSIDYCQWTPRKVGSKLIQKPGINNQEKEAGDLASGRCKIIVRQSQSFHFGDWECIVMFSTQSENQPSYELYHVSVVEARKPENPKILDKEKLTSVVASAVEHASLNNNTVNFTCCVEGGIPIPVLSISFDNKKVVEGSHKDPKTCISWVNTFNIVDDGKLVVCEGYHITLSPGETLQDKLQMKVLHPPIIIDEHKIKKDIVSKLFEREDETIFTFNVTSNPSPNFTWWLLDPVDGKSEPISNETQNIENIFISYFQETKVWEIKFKVQNKNFVNIKNRYRIELFNDIGNTWMDFSITQLVYSSFVNLEAPKTLDVLDGDAVSVRCCVLRMSIGNHTQVKIYLKKDGESIGYRELGSDTKHPFCQEWLNIKFSWVDQDKFLTCNAGNGNWQMEMTVANEDVASGFKLNVLNPPLAILPGGNYEQFSDKIFIDSAFSSEGSEFSVEYVANPKPVINKVFLLSGNSFWTKRQLRTWDRTASIIHQQNTGTLTFKPDAHLISLVSQRRSELQRACVDLQNEYGNLEICFEMQPPNQTSTKAVALASVPPLSSTHNTFQTSTQTSPTLKEDSPSTSESMTTTSKTFVFILSSRHPETPAPEESKTLFTTESTSTIISTLRTLRTLYLSTESEWDDGFFPDLNLSGEFLDLEDPHAVSSTLNFKSTEPSVHLDPTTFEEKPIILNSSRSFIGRCNNSIPTGVTVGFSSRSTAPLNVLWTVLTENSTYASVDKDYNVTTISKGAAVWETTLTIPPCRNKGPDTMPKSYFRLEIRNKYGRDTFIANIERSIAGENSLEVKSSTVLYNTITVISLGVIFVLVLLFLIKWRALVCCGNGRSGSWYVTNDVRLKYVNSI